RSGSSSRLTSDNMIKSLFTTATMRSSRRAPAAGDTATAVARTNQAARARAPRQGLSSLRTTGILRSARQAMREGFYTKGAGLGSESRPASRKGGRPRAERLRLPEIFRDVARGVREANRGVGPDVGDD